MAEPAAITARELFLDQHRTLGAGLPGARLDWLKRLRAGGLERFAELGFPGRKVEAWKYTSLAALEKLAPGPPPPGAADAATPPSLVGGKQPVHRLVFVNGRLRPELSAVGRLPAGVAVGGLAQAIGARATGVEDALGRAGDIDGMPLLALNTAFIDDGYVLTLPADTVLDDPVEIVFVGRADDRPVAYHPRNLIVAGRGSRATVIEYHAGSGAGSYFANGATEILAGEGAIVRHCKVQDEAAAAFHVSTTLARLDRGALLDSFVFSVGARLSRNEIHVRLDAPGAECRLNGAYMMKGAQHVDNTTVIDHASPETSSRELYKGVLDDGAHGVFQGTIVVRPDAQQTNGRQMSHTLLLSDKAEIDTKPELEIYADDVKCSHGATVGALDDDALFYLRSRAIPELDARRILIEAFLGEVIDGIALAGLRAPLDYMVGEWMRPA